ncbi:NAD-dependent epimerase/dehydratase family protein [Actinomadura rayongensis]|uniref:NAD-dependent epimerase/dehydratase family protein n=1 Tax=Actinomadura rayongensis TaxID=1429076 RepID=A0A6I4WID1_9ACTN|nr:NAD-dependent epimerase/dehydratase family protein [Actinomadura rayongensis]MXQ68115.1 NAD-dependent epimerase/dehydratase family protein [Actinomadura rayongensis]
MKVLVLGGTHFVGRAIVEVAISRGHEVTTLNRGRDRTVTPDSGTRLIADRTDREALRAAVADRTWDVVLDTWSGAPRVVRDSARLLADRAGHYGYVSSVSVYRWPIPIGSDEHTAVVDGRPDDDGQDDYAIAKRGGEIAVHSAFENRSLIARAGLVLGPYENVGRLPWWLRRIQRGGAVLAPGEPGRHVQYIDARDLAEWMLAAAERGVGGTFNVVGPADATTMDEILRTAIDVTGSNADLVWAAPDFIEQAGLSPWTELPLWLPPDSEYDGMRTVDSSAAYRAGLSCRPVAETVRDTWDWLVSEGDPRLRPDRQAPGLDRAKEERLLRELAGQVRPAP